MFRRIITKYTHAFIVWYLRKCGGAFHHNRYGVNGIYVAMMSDATYHEYTKL